MNLQRACNETDAEVKGMAPEIWAGIIGAAAAILAAKIAVSGNRSLHSTRKTAKVNHNFREAAGVRNCGHAPSQPRVPHILSITSTVRPEGERHRFHIRVEAEIRTDSDATHGWLTVNLPAISSRPLFETITLQISNSLSAHFPPYWVPPGSNVWGFREDGSHGEMPSKCLLIEMHLNPWKSGERVVLDIALVVKMEELQAHVRTTAIWTRADSGDENVVDPDWSAVSTRDQQGFPAYIITIGRP